MFEFIKKTEQHAKLCVLYVRRILLAPHHIPTTFWRTLRANLSGGFTGDQWELYDLDGRKRKQYLSEFDWYRSRYINAPFDYMLNNKVIAADVLRQYVQVPETRFVKCHGTIADFSGSTYTAAELMERLKEGCELIVKPIDKGKGVGVNAITFADGRFFLDDSPSSEEAVYRILNGRKEWLLQDRIRQHAYADSLFDRTVNTIRIITLRDPQTKRFKVFFAVQRIGMSSTVPVDNASRGGLVCCIDLETGRLSEARSLHNKNVYERHPDSGCRFEDVTIPSWPRIRQEILSLAEHFPYLSFVAWDVMLTREGEPCIVEANTSSGVNIIQLWGGQRQGELGDFYRANGIIK